MNDFFQLFYECSGVCTDTRKISPNCLFICLKGDHFNGNKFAKNALELGAKYVIVDEEEHADDERIFVVENALVFLQKLANYHRRKFNIPVIGITGSNGKTSTKELINAVLSKSYSVLATKGNLNNHIGVPLTLLEMNSRHSIAIIEMGANRFRDIAELCQIAEPTIGIITNIGKAHLEGFGGFEGVLQTKKELYDSVAGINGVIIFNNNDPVLVANIPQSIATKRYGTNNSCDVIGELIELNPFVSLKWQTKNYLSPIIQTNMIGKYNFYNFLAAITFGIHFDVPFEKINEAIAEYTPENNRSQVFKTTNNTLILDCYNANPTSMKSALESFALIEHPHKIIVVGDMLELGVEAEKEHKDILQLISDLDLNGVTVGPLFQIVNQSNNIRSFANKTDASIYLKGLDLKEQLVLLKGSRGIGLETLTAFL